MTQRLSKTEKELRSIKRTLAKKGDFGRANFLKNHHKTIELMESIVDYEKKNKIKPA